MHELARTNRFSRQLGAPIRDDFVGVSVSAGAGTGLKNVERKMLIELPLNHFLSRLDDQRRPFRIEQPQIMIGLRRRPLNQTERADKGTRKAITANRKIK